MIPKKSYYCNNLIIKLILIKLFQKVVEVRDRLIINIEVNTKIKKN